MSCSWIEKNGPASIQLTFNVMEYFCLQIESYVFFSPHVLDDHHD